MAGLLDFPDFLRGLLGGQGPPQQQQPQQQPQGLFPGAGDPSTAAVQNFTASPTLFSGISNALLGARTGQRIDPVGMYQQMAMLTSQTLQRNGVPQPQADLAALNPEAQKAVLGRLFPTYEFKEAGGQGVAFNPFTGTGEPVISMPKGPTQVGPGEVPVFTQPSFPSARSAASQPPLGRTSPIQSQPLPPLGSGAVPTAPPPAASGVSNLPPGVTMGGTPMTLAQKEEQTGLGKTWTDLGKAIQTDAQSASKVKSTISRMRQLNEQAPSGPAAEHWQKFLSAIGIDPTTVAAGTEFEALKSKMVKDAAGGGLGPGYSEGDRRSIEQQVPGLTQDRIGRRKLMDFHEKVADRQLKVQEMAAAWRNRPNNPTRSLEGFAEHIADWAEKNPLFPQQAAPTSTAQSRTPPLEAINALKANPALRGQFDSFYGPGSANKVLGGA